MRMKRAPRSHFWILPLLLFLMLSLPLRGVAGEAEAEALPAFHLGNANLRMVLRSLAEMGEFPLLLAPGVQGEVTMPLRPGLTAREMLELLAESLGYSCSWVEGTAVVGADPATLGERSPRSYQWSFLDERAVVAALARVVPEERLHINGARKEISLAANDLEDRNIREVLAAADRAPVSCLIEAELIEFDLNQVQEKGITWALPRASAVSPVRLTALSASEAAGGGELTGRRLAAARLWAASNQAGAAFLGDQYPVIITQPKTQTDLIEYQKLGLGLEVLPRMLEEGKIGLELALTVRGIGGWTETADGRKVPLIENNRLLVQQTLAPGETVVLAGLTLNGKNSSALILKPGQEGPEQEKTVCVLLTPQVGGNSQGGTPLSSAAGKESPPAGSEVVHIEIVGGAEPEVVTVKPPVAQVLTEVVGFEELSAPAGSDPVTARQSPAQTGVRTEPVQEPATVQGPAAAGQDQGSVPAALKVAYRVVKGDTVFSIARKYGVEPAAILQENAMGSSDLLKAGQTIRIPIPADHLYQLQPKETLWRIAQRYGTTVELLIEINGITDVTTLRTDQIIILPVPVDQVVNDKY